MICRFQVSVGVLVRMKRIGIISYNIYCNFTNYGSALQSWALQQAVKRNFGDKFMPELVDYCPDVLKDENPLDPFKNMWDKDDESVEMCRLSMPAIKENYKKFESFYKNRFKITDNSYDSENFNSSFENENLDGYICGSDTIFCIDEFGFDDGYYANYECMKGRAVAYAASFGDAVFSDSSLDTLKVMMNNFKALGLREDTLLKYISENVSGPVQRVLDPTLLLGNEDYDQLATERLESSRYLLLYARRYNPKMEEYAEKVASEKGLKIIEISLRAVNAGKKNRRMFYEAGVEEFISLVKYADIVVTNSYHGMIFSIQYKKPFKIFTREQCDTKISELIELLGIERSMWSPEAKFNCDDFCYDSIYDRICQERSKSIRFLGESLMKLK